MDEKEAEARPLMGTIFLVIEQSGKGLSMRQKLQNSKGYAESSFCQHWGYLF